MNPIFQSSEGFSLTTSCDIESHPLLTPEQERLQDGFERFSTGGGVVANGSPSHWFLKPLVAAKSAAYAAGQAFQDACDARFVEGQLQSLELPPREDVAAFYQDKSHGLMARHKLLSPCTSANLIVFAKVLAEVVRHKKVNGAVVKKLRVWFDALVGPCDNATEARRRCVRLYLTQHPDKVGERDYGSPLRNLNAKVMMNLLNVSKNVLSDATLAEALYRPEPPRGTGLIPRKAIFFRRAWRACCWLLEVVQQALKRALRRLHP